METFISNIIRIMSRYGHVFLLEGVAYTLLLSLIAVAGGSVLGALFAFGKRGKIPPLRILINALVEIVRGTPLLLQLYAGVFILPRLIPALNELPDIVSVSVVLIINSAAYVSEVIRSGIQAVDIGQTEAARSLGLSERTTMWNVVLPQAVKNILPALLNEFIALLKETSVAGYVGIMDLTKGGDTIRGVTYSSFMPLLAVALIYLVIVVILTKLVSVVERKLRKNER